jgi:hypothetical protein
VHSLAAPDIVAVEEIQDNTGAADDGVVAADRTVARLTAAVVAAGGPQYSSRGINPADDQDGGQPGGNIRTVFLFNPARVDSSTAEPPTSTGPPRPPPSPDSVARPPSRCRPAGSIPPTRPGRPVASRWSASSASAASRCS